MSGNGSDLVANDIMVSLLTGVSFPVPAVDFDTPDFQIPDATGAMAGEVNSLTNDDLTTRIVAGAGTFDALMDAFDAHLRREFEAGRITGNDYTKAYIELSQGAMGASVQFLLGRDSAFWQAVIAQQQARLLQIQAVTAKVELETAKARRQAMAYEALTAEANYALTKIKLATEDAGYAVAQYQLTNILPEQRKMVAEQAETARGQTHNTRLDGTPVNGVLGRQKALYDQQIISYQRDAEVKAAKLFTDAWTVQKTIDEGLVAPTGFTNASLDVVLSAIKTNNGL